MNELKLSYDLKSKNIPEEKIEYDISSDKIEEVSKMTNSKILNNIGSGGFSIVKLVLRESENKYYALKVVNIKLTNN